MYTRILMVMFLVMVLSGCATTNTGGHIQIQQLQNRVNYLEAELEKKDRVISGLENDLEMVKDTALKSSKQRSEEGGIVKLSIRQIQTALKNAGFYKGPIDGRVGRGTRKAIKDFQRANGLKVDGMVGAKTVVKLNEYLKR